MAANQNITQITTVQSGSANATSLFYAVVSGTTDTQLPFSVFVNSLGLTGTPTAPTASTGTNTTQIASTAFVQAQLTSTLAAYATNAGATLTTVSINSGAINGTTVGAGTASTGSFTTLAASGTVGGTGFTNFLSSPTAIGNTAPNSGAFTTLSASGTISPNSTAGIKGTTTNDTPIAGSFGEFVTGAASGVSMTTATPAAVASVSLTAGDWDVSGVVTFNPAGTTTMGVLACSVSTTSGSVSTGNNGNTTQFVLPFTTGQQQLFGAGPLRVSLATTTTVFLNATATFGVSTLTTNGFIRARRVR